MSVDHNCDQVNYSACCYQNLQTKTGKVVLLCITFRLMKCGGMTMTWPWNENQLIPHQPLGIQPIGMWNDKKGESL